MKSSVLIWVVVFVAILMLPAVGYAQQEAVVSCTVTDTNFGCASQGLL
jgi:hypothetical protein